MMRRAVLATMLVVVAGGCGKGRGGGGAGSGSGSGSNVAITGWEAGCTAAFETARNAPPTDRFAIVAEGCPICGSDWAPILATTRITADGHSLGRRDQLAEALKRCGGVCTNQARDAVLDQLGEITDDNTLERPWRRLAKDCPGLLWPAPNERYASAPWYVLTQIARALAPGDRQRPARVVITAPLELPLPAAMVGGNGIELATATNVLPEPPAVHITMLVDQQMVAAVRTARLDADGLTLAGPADYPGAAYTQKALAAAVKAARGDAAGVAAVIAPHAASATRVLEIVGGLAGVPVHLAVFGPPPAEGWRDIPRAAIPALRPGAKGQHAVIGLAPTGAFGVGGDGAAISAGCTQAAGTLDPGELARRAIASNVTPVAIAISPGVTVEQLAVIVDALGGAGIAVVDLVPGSWARWDPSLPACR